MHYKVWNGIIHPLPNFNGATVEVRDWMSIFTPHFNGHVTTYTYRIKLIKVNPCERKGPLGDSTSYRPILGYLQSHEVWFFCDCCLLNRNANILPVDLVASGPGVILFRLIESDRYILLWGTVRWTSRGTSPTKMLTTSNVNASADVASKRSEAGLYKTLTRENSKWNITL